MSFNNNTLLLKAVEGDGVSAINTTIVDGPTGGRTVRTADDGFHTLTIAQGESNENPGFITRRSNIRLAARRGVTESDKSVTGYAQVTLSFPNEGFTVAQKQHVIQLLIGFILLGDSVSEVPVDLTAYETAGGHEFIGNNNAVMNRLLAGEP
jgi:hypothetical protein